MSELAKVMTPTWIITASSTVVVLDLETLPNSPKYDFVIVKNDGTDPVFFAVFETPEAAALATYPVAGTAAAVPQKGKTILGGQPEVYQKEQKERYMALIMKAATTADVHVTAGSDK